MSIAESPTSLKRAGNLPRFSTVRLSKCEREALELIARGHDSKTVAELLYISKRTVDTRLANIYNKLEVNNRISAIRAAQQFGFLPFEKWG